MSNERRLFAALVALGVIARAAPAAAQACCAGSGAVTPGRLGLHDEADVGVQLRATSAFGSNDASGTYVPAPAGAREIDLEQDLYGAVRVLRRGQLGVLLPFVQTHRASGGLSELGGGVGDVNVSARYDPLLARESRWCPGVGLLAGVTLPTGRPPEAAQNPLATDATGLGAVQLNGGLALEQSFGPWSVGVSGLLAWRAPRAVGGTTMELAPQLTLLASLAYAFPSGFSAALVASYTAEDDASVGGRSVAGSSRRWALVSAAIAWPVTDQLFLVGSVFFNPPMSSLGVNQPTTVGTTLGMKWAFL